MKLRNPGGWSFAIFGGACAVAIAAFAFKAPEAGKIATTLIGLVGVWFARSAVTADSTDGGGE